MRGTIAVRVSIAALAWIGVAADTADAAFCRKKSGAIFVRKACRKRETAADLQGRVTGACAAGMGMAAIAADGSVTCQSAIDPAASQARVTGTCTAGAAMSAIAADGSVTCQPAGVFAYGQIRETGTIRSASSNVSGVARIGAGKFCVSFSNAPASVDQLESAVASLAGNATSGVAFVRVQNGQDNFICDGLAIGITDVSGVYVDARFSFVVP